MKSQHISRTVIAIVFVGTVFSGSYSLAQRCEICDHPRDGTRGYQFLISTTNLDFCLTSQIALAESPKRENDWMEEHPEYLWRIRSQGDSWQLIASGGMLLTADVCEMTVSLKNVSLQRPQVSQLWKIERASEGLEISVQVNGRKYWLGVREDDVLLLDRAYRWCCEKLHEGGE